MLTLRKVEQKDLDLLYQWANDPIVRQNSFNSNLIPYDDHVSWFDRMINNPSVIQYIMMEKDIPIGQIRLNVDGESAEIGYSIATEYRGQGYGRKILELVLDKVKQDHPEIKKLIAKVKPENNVSNRLFCDLGYEMKYKCYSLKI